MFFQIVFLMFFHMVFKCFSNVFQMQIFFTCVSNVFQKVFLIVVCILCFLCFFCVVCGVCCVFLKILLGKTGWFHFGLQFIVGLFFLFSMNLVCCWSRDLMVPLTHVLVETTQ